MKLSSLTKICVLLIGSCVATSSAQAATTYLLELTNGSSMPVSPAAIYVQNGQSSRVRVGQTPTPGFIQLCQTGNPATRIQELAMNQEVSFKTQTNQPILPGESRTVEIEVQDPLQQSVQFELMYGKTKDVCAVASIGSHSLYALKQHVTSEIVGQDRAVQTGAFQDPALPAGRSYLDRDICVGSMDAVSCLRSLSTTVMGAQKVKFFSSYLSSLTMLLESKYGAGETQSLLLPASGAVQFQLKLKH